MSERKQLNILMGERIRVAREAAGLTQENLADEIGVSGQFISDLERGKVGTSVPRLVRLCEALSVSADYILVRNDIQQNNEVDPMEILTIVNSLSPEESTLMYQNMKLMRDAFQLNKPEIKEEGNR